MQWTDKKFREEGSLLTSCADVLHSNLTLLFRRGCRGNVSKWKKKKTKTRKKRTARARRAARAEIIVVVVVFFHELCKLLSPSSLCKVRNRDVGNENGTWKPKFMLYFKHEFKCFIAISNNEKTIEIRGPPGPSVLLFSSCLSWQWNTQNECLE